MRQAAPCRVSKFRQARRCGPAKRTCSVPRSRLTSTGNGSSQSDQSLGGHFKLHSGPDKTTTQPSRARTVATPWGNHIGGRAREHTVNVVLHKGVSADSVRNKIAAVAGLNPAAMEVSQNKIRPTIERRRLKDLAATDEVVRHIEPYIAPKLANNIARDILRANEAEGCWWSRWCRPTAGS
jgi:hypothetical protein